MNIISSRILGVSIITFVFFVLSFGAFAHAQGFDTSWDTGVYDPSFDTSWDTGWNPSWDTSWDTGLSWDPGFDTSWDTGVYVPSFDTSWDTGVYDPSFDTSWDTGWNPSWDTSWDTGLSWDPGFDTSWDTGVYVPSFDTSWDTGVYDPSFDTSWDTGSGLSYLDDVPVNYLDDVPLNYLDDVPLNYLDDVPLNYLDDVPCHDCYDYSCEYGCYTDEYGVLRYSFSQPAYSSYSTPAISRPVTISRPTSVVVKPITIPQKTVQYTYPTYPTTPTYPQYNQPWCTISASPSTITQGGTSVTLTWNSNHASTAYFYPGGEKVGVSGTKRVHPTRTTTYTLHVYGAYGQRANCQTTVVVDTHTPPPAIKPYCTISLSYGNTSWDSWQNWNVPATLTWTSTYATSAYINGVGSVNTSGSRTVYPTPGQVYTMNVYGPGGNSSCQTSGYPTPVPPTPPPHPTNLYCTLTASPSSIRDGDAAVLSWNAYGATTAWLSDGLGAVSTSGSLYVRPNSSRTYTMTVSDGYGRTQNCYATVNVSGSSPYVYLSQLPYTGFDLGPVGNALYFVTLMALAAAAGYLVVYYRGGVLALATDMVGSRKVAKSEIADADDAGAEEDTAPAAPAPAPEGEKAQAFSGDTMVLARSKDGSMPRITIERN